MAAIQDITLASSELNVTYSRSEAQDQDANLEQELVVSADIGQGQTVDGRTPPQEAITACNDKIEQDTCEFTWERGTETGVCEMVEEQLACSPLRGQPGEEQIGGGQVAETSSGGVGAAYNIEQALSDRAQGMTIAFDALAFLTGDLGSDSFFPPGKVADFWGFQYMR
ncbi:MAG: hypothetical protein GY934_14140, partial [Gammaproteobacteria bacterium]|nr:hypothetical protein [Gammaproteobacteria bacterium]